MNKRLISKFLVVVSLFTLGLTFFSVSSSETAQAATDNRTRRVLISYDVKEETNYNVKPPKKTVTKYNYKYANVSIHARYQKTTTKVIQNFPLIRRYTDVYK